MIFGLKLARTRVLCNKVRFALPILTKVALQQRRQGRGELQTPRSRSSRTRRQTLAGMRAVTEYLVELGWTHSMIFGLKLARTRVLCNKVRLCFPSYETIAEAAHCARSTVAEALKALEGAGVLSWVQRIKRTLVHMQINAWMDA